MRVSQRKQKDNLEKENNAGVTIAVPGTLRGKNRWQKEKAEFWLETEERILIMQLKIRMKRVSSSRNRNQIDSSRKSPTKRSFRSNS